MARVTESIEVNIPVEEAYEKWTHLEAFPKFLDFVDSVTKIDETRSHWKVKIGDDVREFDAEMEQHPFETIAWTSVGGEKSGGEKSGGEKRGDDKHSGIVTFEKLAPVEGVAPASSRITVEIHWPTEGLREKVGAVFGVDDRVVRKDLKKFKEIVEGRASDVAL